MFRKTLTILSLLGLLLSVGLWGVSYINVDYLGRRYHSSLFGGAISLGRYEDPPMPTIEVRCLGFKTWHTYWIPRYEDYSGVYSVTKWEVVFPLWIPTALLAIPPFNSHIYSRRRRKCKKLGLCEKCGYDLRGSKERCPECGKKFESSGV